VYAATTIALAMLDTLAHLGGNIAIRNAFLVRIDVSASVWKSRRTTGKQAGRRRRAPVRLRSEAVGPDK
jgi:hypothetical protein